ncbi:purine-nucleoside phosphorylase [Mongoliitalea daihaiensis]|uniref:purine-nucleoside phosphorylase n=1 Tax=Mongoliitalea daihaiensis TaxID=2782006 RepID=UPI001F1AD318|nr:purine-nucleoside phosphorylase [Mongoliitalea daihaiensis]UJP66570.1 purine-nucleoside phosphorylase [Mongoliitalea daihaiensis]
MHYTSKLTYLEQAQQAAGYIQSVTKGEADVLVILGSGLGGFVNELEEAQVISYQSIPFFPISTVEGHSGQLMLGKIKGKFVWVMSGRFHYYEGYELEETVFPLRVLSLLGLKGLIVSNAAGGLNPDFSVGDLMLITDHIDKFPSNALRGKDAMDFGIRFPDMSEPYSQAWIAQAKSEALGLGISLREGTYVGVTGPSLETKAEINYYRTLGGDAVGMSTVPEVIAAQQMGMKVLGFSVITNECIPKNNQSFSHDSVVEVAQQAGRKLQKLIACLV